MTDKINQSTYTTEQVIVERLIGELYGMAKGKSTNKTQLATIEKTHTDLLFRVWHTWNECEGAVKNLKEEVTKLLQTNEELYRKGEK